MPIRKTEAVVLRIHPFSNTSQMVVWLTQEGFRLPTAVKGAVRPKSAFLGQYDLFQTCELLYYTRTRDGVYIPRECCTLRRRDNLRVNWRAEHVASWCAALADLTATSDVPMPELYRLLDRTLTQLDAFDSAPPPLFLAQFETRLLCLAGLRPNFSGPGASAVAEAGAQPRIRFNLVEGCLAEPPPETPDGAAGRPPPNRDPTLTLSPEIIALFTQLADAPEAEPLPAAPSAGALTGLLRFLGLFIRFHLPDASTAGRALALAALRPPAAPAVAGHPAVAR